MSDETHRRWIEEAEHWGEWVRYPDDRPGDPESIWMLKRGVKVRFYGVGRGQVGPEHPHVVAATCWAYANGWVNPDAPFDQQVRARQYVLAGGAELDRHDPTFVGVAS